MQLKTFLNGNAKYLVPSVVKVRARTKSMRFEVPNVALYINFIMHSLIRHGANIYFLIVHRMQNSDQNRKQNFSRGSLGVVGVGDRGWVVCLI